ncbi:Alpha-tubulin N-acetyltransferase [Halotydeus destructor]|nr:Alpha-tubulin N-acetyltransferase [Halotydeus destructor]
MSVVYGVASVSNKDKLIKICKLWSHDGSSVESVDQTQLKTLIEENISEWMNNLGEKSAREQELKVPITSFEKFLNVAHNPYSPVKLIDTIHLLLRVESNGTKVVPLGFLRTGIRSLYFDKNGTLTQVNDCFSVLDFFVEEQRKGHGRILFSQVLEMSNKNAVKCAIDRPSTAMISFLNKHFSLENPLEQHNRYVIFDGFFGP